MQTNPDTFAHFEINRWFLEVGPQELLDVVKQVSQRLSSMDPAERAPAKRVLELIFGTLDPMVAQAPLGQRFKSRLFGLAGDLGISKTELRARFAPELELRQLFSDLADTTLRP